MLASLRMRGLLQFIVLFLFAFGTPAAAAEPPFAPARAGERVVYRGATLIDGTGARPRRAMAVITDGARIEAVLPAARLTPRQLEGARFVDLTGRFLLPGLIDSHQHLATPPNARLALGLMRRELYNGVTSLRIMADDLRSIAELDRAARAGEIAAPDLYFAALVAGRSFFADPRTEAVSFGYTPGEAPWAQAIDEATDLPLAIARARGTGAVALKIYADLPPDLVARLATEAHRQGLRVWAHGMVFPTTPAEVVAAGPDVVSHSCYLAYQAMPRRPQTYAERFPVDAALFVNGDNGEMAALFRTMRERGIILDATLNVYDVIERAGRPTYCSLDLAGRLTAQARRAGVRVSAGTDAGAPWNQPYPSLFNEIELLVSRAGFTPLEAIRAATQVGAMTLGKADTLGVIAPGRVADLVVVERDPIADIANLRSVLFTVKHGRRFDRADYVPMTAEEGADE